MKILYTANYLDKYAQQMAMLHPQEADKIISFLYRSNESNVDAVIQSYKIISRAVFSHNKEKAREGLKHLSITFQKLQDSLHKLAKILQQYNRGSLPDGLLPLEAPPVTKIDAFLQADNLSNVGLIIERAFQSFQLKAQKIRNKLKI